MPTKFQVILKIDYRDIPILLNTHENSAFRQQNPRACRHGRHGFIIHKFVIWRFSQKIQNQQKYKFSNLKCVSITVQYIAHKAGVIALNYYNKMYRSLPFAAWKRCFFRPSIKLRYLSNKFIKFVKILWVHFQEHPANNCKIL